MINTFSLSLPPPASIHTDIKNIFNLYISHLQVGRNAAKRNGQDMVASSTNARQSLKIGEI